MTKIYIFCAVLFGALYFSQGIDTQTRDNAGASGAGIKSGFYETVNPVNFPNSAAGWWHLLDVRHTNPGNNYAMQFAGSFGDQHLFFRKTDNSATKAWSKILLETPDGKVTIGGNIGPEKVSVQGGHESTTFLMHADNESSPHAYLTMWASEPQVTYDGVGIGNNIRNYGNGQAFTRIDNSKGGSYVRLLGHEINFNIVSSTGVTKQALILRQNGNAALQGKLEATEVKVTTTPTADFVFDDEYMLPRLEEVEKHIRANKHLPEIASAKEMEREGVNIGEFQIKLLQKIEELTLYSIEQNKRLKEQAERIQKLEEMSASKK